jgi:hypothetical protein
MSYKKVRTLLVESYFNGVIDDEEFFEKSRIFWNYERFHLEEMSDAECKAEFRFLKDDIPVVAEAMCMPDRFIYDQGTVCDGIEGLVYC